ncbi:MAG TPA: hypothetical protein VFK03_00725 [Candidatus Saccharimonadales bacterium]|nr:hypothetical protein [Candidatus Saccharimonadales bacterium]
MTELIVGNCMFRDRETQAGYESYIRRLKEQHGGEAPCPFCGIEADDPGVVLEEGSMYVIKNRFPYTIYDGQEVTDHLLLIPKRHVLNLGALAIREKDDYFALYAKLEDEGYSAVTRAPGANSRSIQGHVHTHQFKYGRLVSRQHFDRGGGLNDIGYVG